jgi:hypothetical protein
VYRCPIIAKYNMLYFKSQSTDAQAYSPLQMWLTYIYTHFYKHNYININLINVVIHTLFYHDKFLIHLVKENGD